MPRNVPARASFASAPLALTLFLVGAATALSVPGSATAGVYKCKSADGEVLYLDHACPTDHAGEQVNVYTHQSATPAPVDSNPYSVVNQARMIVRREEYQRRNALMEKINASPNDATALQLIDNALVQLSQDESSLQSQIGGQSVSSQWAQDDVASIKAQRAQLLQARASVVARMKEAADRDLRVRAARAEATAQAAMAKAQAAEATARSAEAAAQDAGAQAQGAANAANRAKFCQPQAGGTMFCY